MIPWIPCLFGVVTVVVLVTWFSFNVLYDPSAPKSSSISATVREARLMEFLDELHQEPTQLDGVYDLWSEIAHVRVSLQRLRESLEDTLQRNNQTGVKSSKFQLVSRLLNTRDEVRSKQNVVLSWQSAGLDFPILGYILDVLSRHQWRRWSRPYISKPPAEHSLLVT